MPGATNARGRLSLPLLCCAALALADEAPALPSFYLSAGFSSDMVLQQAPAKAAIYGFGEGPVSVTVSGTSAAGASVDYTVDALGADAAATGSTNGASAAGPTWKAFLKPAAAGGSYAVTAKGASGTVVLHSVTFGDVYFCSGAFYFVTRAGRGDLCLSINLPIMPPCMHADWLTVSSLSCAVCAVTSRLTLIGMRAVRVIPVLWW